MWLSPRHYGSAPWALGFWGKATFWDQKPSTHFNVGISSPKFVPRSTKVCWICLCNHFLKNSKDHREQSYFLEFWGNSTNLNNVWSKKKFKLLHWISRSEYHPKNACNKILHVTPIRNARSCIATNFRPHFNREVRISACFRPKCLQTQNIHSIDPAKLVSSSQLGYEHFHQINKLHISGKPIDQMDWKFQAVLSWLVLNPGRSLLIRIRFHFLVNLD